MGVLFRRRGLKVIAYKSKVMVLGMRRECSVRSVWIVHEWNKCQSSNIWGVFWINKVKMFPSIIGRWQVGGKLQLL